MSTFSQVEAAKPKHDETILVVEDDPLLLEFVSDLLIELGYQVLTSADTDVALEVLEEKKSPINLVFTDIRIPGELNGVSLARKIRAEWPEIKILLTTGYDPEFMEEPIQDEFHILPKPYYPNDLEQAVRIILGKSLDA
jgi:CheY-like chemotaxis protein